MTVPGVPGVKAWTVGRDVADPPPKTTSRPDRTAPPASCVGEARSVTWRAAPVTGATLKTAAEERPSGRRPPATSSEPPPARTTSRHIGAGRRHGAVVAWSTRACRTDGAADGVCLTGSAGGLAPAEQAVSPAAPSQETARTARTRVVTVPRRGIDGMLAPRGAASGRNARDARRPA